MITAIDVKNRFFICLSLFFLFIVLHLFILPLFFIKPIFFIGYVISLAVFSGYFYLFFPFLVSGILIFKYLYFLYGEYLILLAMGLLFFVIWRFFLFKRNLFSVFVLVFVGEILLWTLMGKTNVIFSPVFVMEFLYTLFFSILFFILGLWLKKKFS